MSVTTPAPLTPPSWESLILCDLPPAAAWIGIFARMLDVAMETPTPAALHRETIIPDRLLAEGAWDLWQDFREQAPKAIDSIREFWTAPSTSAGSAVLILDALSMRELPLIVAGARRRNIAPTRVLARGSLVPSESDQFAAALGLPSRSKLFNNRPPSSFIFSGADVHTDVLEEPFADCVARIPPKPRLFIWHKWPDEPLIHDHAEAREGEAKVAAEIKRALASDGFWAFVDGLRQGRRLLITGDHGYATASEFSSEVRDPQTTELLAGTFGAQRAIREDPAKPWPRRLLPPPVLKFEDAGGTWLVVIGQRKWKVRGGYPTLCHRGLSLLEAVVPVIEFPAL